MNKDKYYMNFSSIFLLKIIFVIWNMYTKVFEAFFPFHKYPFPLFPQLNIRLNIISSCPAMLFRSLSPKNYLFKFLKTWNI